MLGDNDADSLIGDSTLGELLDESTLQTNEAPLGGVQTSGLSYCENDTIDRIEPDVASANPGWFSKKRHHQEQQQQQPQEQERPNTLCTPRRILQSPISALSPELQLGQWTPKPQESAANKNEEVPRGRPEPPGFIFVMSGRSSTGEAKVGATPPNWRNICQLKKNEVRVDAPKKGLRVDTTSPRRSRCLYGKIGAVILLLAVTLAIVMLTIVFQQKRESEETSSRTSVTGPTSQPIFTPTSMDVGVSATEAPAPSVQSNTPNPTQQPQPQAPMPITVAADATEPTNSPTSSPVTPTDPPKAAQPKEPEPAPTPKPITQSPTNKPTPSPTRKPTSAPTLRPSRAPAPVVSPTKAPTGQPSLVPRKQQTPRPTMSPTKAPTKSPTAKPTPGRAKASPRPSPSSTEAPTSCSAEIATDKDCYSNGEDVIMNFKNCNEEPDDWIGVYLSGEDPTNLGDPIAWMWACGDSVCQKSISAGTATFYEAKGSGNFQVFMIRRNTNGPYEAYGSGNEFSFGPACDGGKARKLVRNDFFTMTSLNLPER
jgi:hypothetical protein